MRALLFGVAPRGGDPVDTDNPLLAALERTPMDLVDLPDPGFLLPDWVVTRPLLTGICGSDAKQVFMDWGEGGADNPMLDFSSMPQVLGHEVVAEVVALGPRGRGRRRRRPGGAQPVAVVRAARRLAGLPGVRGRRPEPVLELPDAADRAGHPHRHVEGRERRVGRTLMPAHPSMLFPVPDAIADEVAVFADPFAVSLHASRATRRRRAARCSCTARARSARRAVAILRALYPDVEVGVVARFGAQADAGAEVRRARVFAHEPAEALIEEAAAWSGGVLSSHTGLPMAFPGGIDVVYDTISKRETLEVRCGCSRRTARW